MKKGSALLQTLVGTVFAAGLILAVFQYSTFKSALSRKLEDRTAHLTLQQFVRKNIDCPAALYPAGGNCTDGAWLNASDLSGNPLAQGDSGAILHGAQWALRIRCQQNPAPHLKVEYAKIAVGATPDWSDLYNGSPLSCAAPVPVPPPPPPPGCTVVNASISLNEPRIAAALGIPANDWIIDDTFHAHMACRKSSYLLAVSHTTKTGNTGCLGKKIHAWSKANAAFAKVDACQSERHLKTVTCQFKETGVCPCATEKELLDPGATNLVASNFSNVRFMYSFRFDCMAYPGTMQSFGSTRCPRIYSDTATRTKVCELLGYSTVVSYVQDSYSTCGNNSVAKWNSGTSTFDAVPSCGSNRFVRDIKCSNPIPATCQSFY